jgi:transcriptional regulator with XRE-family HTH domain
VPLSHEPLETQAARLALRDTVAANLRAERARAGLTQSHLAERVGLSRTTYADLETGRRGFLLADLVEICEALDVGLFALLQGTTGTMRRARRALQVVSREDLDRLAASVVPPEILERVLDQETTLDQEHGPA